MTRVFIINDLLSSSERAVVEELMAAKLEQHLADRAKYMRKDSARAGQPTATIQEAGSPGAVKPAYSTITLRCPECAGPLVEDQPDHGVYCPECWAWECRQEES